MAKRSACCRGWPMDASRTASVPGSEQHVADCRECERELDSLRTLQSVFEHSAPPRADTTAARHAEAGWKRLRPRLRGEVAPPMSAWRALQRQFLQAPRWMGAAVMAQALTLLVLAMALWRPAAMAAGLPHARCGAGRVGQPGRGVRSATGRSAHARPVACQRSADRRWPQ